MTYSVKEMFLTVQGEGGQAGRPAVFLRFAGCNLWNGLGSHRASAVCTFCDTDFVGVDAVTTSDVEELREMRRECERRVRRGSDEDCSVYQPRDDR